MYVNTEEKSSPASNPQEHSSEVMYVNTEEKSSPASNPQEHSSEVMYVNTEEKSSPASNPQEHSSEVMYVNTEEEEVSSTLSGDQTLSTSLAVSSESPNSMNSTGSSDSGSCDHDIRSDVGLLG